MHPMLTDFGIARLADSPGLTRTHEFVGTPAYVAPESAEGRPQTSAVDIYGAGILLYELVTGRPPFAGGTALEVLHRHLSEEPRRPTTVPDAAVDGHRALPAQEPGPAAQRREPGPRAADRRRGHRRARQLGADRRRATAWARCSPPTRRPPPVPGADPGRGRPDTGAAAAPRVAYDPNAATSVHAARPPARRTRAGPQGGVRRPDRASCRPCRRGARRARRSPRARTRGSPSCSAARDRNEQTAGPVPRPEPGPAAPPPPAPAAAAPAAAAAQQQQRPAAASSTGSSRSSSAYPQRRQQQQYARSSRSRSPSSTRPAHAAAAPAAAAPRSPASRGSAAPTRRRSRASAASRAVCSPWCCCSSRAG